MKRMFIGMMCVGMFLMMGVINASAAPKATKSKKAPNKAAEDMQCHEVTLLGMISKEQEQEIKDEAGKVVAKHKYRTIMDSKKKEWRLPDNSTFNLSDFEEVKVKLVGMAMGNGLVGIKSLEKAGK